LPRPREFDEGHALEAAMQRFWANGFAGTSVRELGEAMGLAQASVYNACGDKRAFFTQCLDRYLDANMRARIARVEKSFPPRQAIEAFLTEILERSLESRLGCLLANAALGSTTLRSRRSWRIVWANWRHSSDVASPRWRPDRETRSAGRLPACPRRTWPSGHRDRSRWSPDMGGRSEIPPISESGVLKITA
jgi:AcrR family transcriptional regulator